MFKQVPAESDWVIAHRETTDILGRPLPPVKEPEPHATPAAASSGGGNGVFATPAAGVSNAKPRKRKGRERSDSSRSSSATPVDQKTRSNSHGNGNGNGGSLSEEEGDSSDSDSDELEIGQPAGPSAAVPARVLAKDDRDEDSTPASRVRVEKPKPACPNLSPWLARASASSSGSREPLRATPNELNLPVASETRHPCLIKLYDFPDGAYKLNDVIEVVVRTFKLHACPADTTRTLN